MTFYRASYQWIMPEGETAVNTIGIEDDGLSSTEAVATAAAGAFQSGMGSATDLFSGATSCHRVTVYRLPGLVPPNAATEVAEADITFGGTGAGGIPNQVSIVATLLTGAPGRSRRGRIYLPVNNGAGFTANGRLTVANTVILADAVAAWFGAINSVASGRYVKVFSPTTGTANTVTQVSVGDVADTQRSRRGDLVESRSFSDVSTI